jgi:hypothetical protein
MKEDMLRGCWPKPPRETSTDAEGDRASYIGGAAPSALTAAGTDHYWSMDNAAATGETDDFGSADLTEVGTVGYENTGGGPTGPTINTQPSNASVTAPATANFTVSATASAGTLTYQWQQSTNSGSSWASVPDGTGATSASYTTTATAVSTGSHRNGYQYRCAVTDSNGPTNTSAATLTVTAAPLAVTLALTGENDVPVGVVTVPKVFAIRYSDNTLLHTFASVTTNSSGQVTLSHASLTATDIVFVPADSAGAKLAGAKFYTPA